MNESQVEEMMNIESDGNNRSLLTLAAVFDHSRSVVLIEKVGPLSLTRTHKIEAVGTAKVFLSNYSFWEKCTEQQVVDGGL